MGRVDGDFGPQKEVLCGALLLHKGFCVDSLLVAHIWSERAPEEVLCGEVFLAQRVLC